MNAPVAEIPDPERWAKVWADAITGKPPRPRRGAAPSVEPFPHRSVPDLALVTARFSAGRKQREMLAYNTIVERQLAHEIGAKALIIVPDGDAGLKVRFLVRADREAA